MLSSLTLHTIQHDLVRTAYCSPVTGEKGKTLGKLCVTTVHALVFINYIIWIIRL